MTHRWLSQLSDNTAGVWIITWDVRDSQSDTDCLQTFNLHTAAVSGWQITYFFCDGASLETPLTTTSTRTRNTTSYRNLQTEVTERWTRQRHVFILARAVTYRTAAPRGGVTGDDRRSTVTYIVAPRAFAWSHPPRRFLVVDSLRFQQLQPSSYLPVL